MKKTLSKILALLLVFAFAFSACASEEQASEQTTTANEETTQTADGITINFWHSMTSGANYEAIKTMVAEFNETNTSNITVVETPQGDYNECSAKLQQAIAAGNNPEVSMLDRALIPQYAPMGVLSDMTSYVEASSVDVDDFVDGLMVFSSVDDQLLSLPFNRSTPVFYWNKALFEAAGLDPETPPTTYAELMEYAEKLTVVEGDKTSQYGFGMTIDAGWYFMGMIQQQGERMLSEDGDTVLFTDNDSGLVALQYWKDLVDSGYYAIPDTTDAYTALLEDFYQGRVAMMYASTGSLAATLENTENAGVFDLGIGYMMQFDTQSCPTGGANLVMLDNVSDEQKAAAWEFIEFATSTEQAAQWSVATGYVPTRVSAVETDVIQTLWQEHPQYEVAYNQLQFANDTCYSQYFWEYNSMMNTIISSLVQDNSLTPEQAIEQMAEEATFLFPGNQ